MVSPMLFWGGVDGSENATGNRVFPIGFAQNCITGMWAFALIPLIRAKHMSCISLFVSHASFLMYINTV